MVGMLLLPASCSSGPRPNKDLLRPTKAGAAGERRTTPRQHEERTLGQPRDDAEDPTQVLQGLDDDIAAWKKAYALGDPSITMLEAGLTRRAREQFSFLQETLAGRNQAHRMVAAAALGFSDDERAVPSLVEILLVGDDERVTENSLMGLAILAARRPEAAGRIPTEAVVPYLSGEEVPLGLRRAAVFLATHIVSSEEDRGLTPYLVAASEDSSPHVRANAVLGLGTVGTAEARAVVVTALQHDPSDEVRANAALALTHGRDLQVGEALVEALSDPSPEVRNTAAGALSLLTNRNLGHDAEAWRRHLAQARAAERAGADDPPTGSP